MAYHKILDYWFPKDANTIPKFWFDASPETDKYIIDNFTELLQLAEKHLLNDWKRSVKGHLALIILLDQFSRHIYRGGIDTYKNDLIAYFHTQEFFVDNKDKDLTILEKMMALMPYRHQEKKHTYDLVINYIQTETDPLWDKFKFHTKRKYEEILSKTESFSRYPFICDKYTSILEYPWSCNMQKPKLDIKIEDIVLTLRKYIINNMNKDKNNLIIVSLSGGVDSMVILYILKMLNIISIVAVHLDYHNRIETGLEAEFLFEWCNFMNIPLYYRYIHEGTREEVDREKYEELTKQIRFNLYKKVRSIYSDYNCLGVVLGHHKGDLQENVFFNLMKGRTLTDLTVIKEQSEIMGVNILRLLLSHPKSDIFEFAHKYRIPYFKNTTPRWSNRGKYREVIQPALIGTFGEGILTNLSKISKESDELQLMIQTNILDPYFKTIEIKENEHYLPKTLNQPLTYWKYIIHEWCHRNKLPIVSHKLIVLLHEKMYYTFKTIINCSATLKITITNDYLIISFTQ